jgi:hypothetical protein
LFCGETAIGGSGSSRGAFLRCLLLARNRGWSCFRDSYVGGRDGVVAAANSVGPSRVLAGAIELLLPLRLKLLLLEMPLFLKRLLPLNCGKKIMSLEVFRIIVANTLFLHLFVFLKHLLNVLLG